MIEQRPLCVLPDRSARDDDSIHRVLFLLPFPPRGDALHGGGRVTAQLITALASRVRVGLLYLAAPDEPALDEAVESLCDFAIAIPRPPVQRTWQRRARLVDGLLRGQPMWATDWRVPEFARRLQAVVDTWQPDVIQSEFHIMAQYAAALGRGSAPRILNTHEAGIVAASDALLSLRGPAKALAFADKLCWQRYERRIVAAVQTVVVNSARDRAAMESLGQATPIVQIPFGTLLPERALNPLGSAPESLLFVGNFAHPPNGDAALRLVERIFPTLRARFPQLELTIVGNQPPPELVARAPQGVVFTGRVPDVTPYLDRAAVVVAPLRLGGGTRVKVLEALASGKAVVATPLAAEGIDVTDGVHILLGESDAGLCFRIEQVLTRPRLRAEVATHARQWACRNLGWQRPVEAFDSLYAELRAAHSVRASDY